MAGVEKGFAWSKDPAFIRSRRMGQVDSLVRVSEGRAFRWLLFISEVDKASCWC